MSAFWKNERVLSGFDRIALFLFILLLLFLTVIIPALSFASSPGYYHRQFEKNGIYAHEEYGKLTPTPIHYIDGDWYLTAEFSDEQLDGLSEHIIAYLFGDKEDFSLVMDGVKLNGVMTDGVSIFSEKAVSHMADVKALMQRAEVFSYIGGVASFGILAYILRRRKHTGRLALRYTAFVLVFLVAIALLICLISLFTSAEEGSFADALWRNLHYLLFFFDREKVEGSFFNDTLTQILTLELFMTAVKWIVFLVLLVFSAWTVAAVFMRRFANKQTPPSLDNQSGKEDLL